TPLDITFKDALTFMIIESDNTATNLVIDHVGLQNVNQRITQMGLKDTYLYKKVYKPATGPMPADQKKLGQNYSPGNGEGDGEHRALRPARAEALRRHAL